MDEITIASSVNGTQSQLLKFQNPFLEPITVSLVLHQETNVFNLMLSKRQTFTIGPLDFIDIPFTFSPKEFQSATAQISIQMNPELTWNFPIRAIPEMSLPIKPIILEGKSRQKVSKDFEVALIGLKGNGEKLLITFESSSGEVNDKEFLEVRIRDISSGPSPNLLRFHVVIFINVIGCFKFQKAC